MAMPVGATLDHCGHSLPAGPPFTKGNTEGADLHTARFLPGGGTERGRLEGKVPSERLPGCHLQSPHTCL